MPCWFARSDCLYPHSNPFYLIESHGSWPHQKPNSWEMHLLLHILRKGTKALKVNSTGHSAGPTSSNLGEPTERCPFGETELDPRIPMTFPAQNLVNWPMASGLASYCDRCTMLQHRARKALHPPSPNAQKRGGGRRELSHD